MIQPLPYESENSEALGFALSGGSHLGLLHMEIVQERLEREFGLNLLNTAPSVKYQIYLRDGSKIEIDNPSRVDLKLSKYSKKLKTPYVKVPYHLHLQNIWVIW